MKYFLIVIQAIFFNSFAHAQITPFEGTSIRLVGRGIQLRKDPGNIIALACVGKGTHEGEENNCNEVQYLFFSKDQKTFLLGNPIPVTHLENETPSDEDLSAKSKELSKSYGKFYREEHGTNLKRLSVTMITGGTTALLWKSGGHTGFFIMIGTMLITPAMFFTNNISLLGNLDKAVYATFDQNGWNWSTKPKNVNEAKFITLLNFAEENSGCRFFPTSKFCEQGKRNYFQNFLYINNEL